jgi:hypothetical protein
MCGRVWRSLAEGRQGASANDVCIVFTIDAGNLLANVFSSKRCMPLLSVLPS